MNKCTTKIGKKIGRPPREVPALRRQFFIEEDLFNWLSQFGNNSAVVNAALRSLQAQNPTREEIHKMLH
jgi:hypothetical protein